MAGWLDSKTERASLLSHLSIHSPLCQFAILLYHPAMLLWSIARPMESIFRRQYHLRQHKLCWIGKLTCFKFKHLGTVISCQQSQLPLSRYDFRPSLLGLRYLASSLQFVRFLSPIMILNFNPFLSFSLSLNSNAFLSLSRCFLHQASHTLPLRSIVAQWMILYHNESVRTYSLSATSQRVDT